MYLYVKIPVVFPQTPLSTFEKFSGHKNRWITLTQIVRITIDHNGAANDRLGPVEAQQTIGVIESSGAFVVGDDVAKVADVALIIARRQVAVGSALRIEVSARACAALRQVAVLVDTESVRSFRQVLDLAVNSHRSV